MFREQKWGGQREVGEEEIGVDLIKTHYKKFPNHKKDALHNNSDPQPKKMLESD